MRPLRVAVIGLRGIPSNYGGVEVACERLYSILASKGHSVTAYCRPEYAPPRGPAFHNGIRLLAAPAIRWKSFDTLSYSTWSVLAAALKGNYDVIHLHTLAPGLLSGVCRLLQIPTVVTVHGLDWKRAKWGGMGSAVLQAAERSIVKHASAVIVVSENLQSYFYNKYQRTTCYIPNGVDTRLTSLTDESVLAQFALHPQGYVAYIGRLVPEKRVEDLIRAFLRTETTQHLAIVGEAGYTDSYEQSLRRLASDDSRIVFTGLQRGDALEVLFRNATACVFPSALEGLPLALLECLAYGTPAIATDIAPHQELLANIPGHDLFFQVGDTSGLTELLHRVIGSPQRYKTIAVEAQAKVVVRYNWEDIAQATEAVYEEATMPRSKKRHSATMYGSCSPRDGDNIGVVRHCP